MDNKDSKDLKSINILIPESLTEIKPELEILINKNENIIKKYLERQIYKSVISETNSQTLNIIFSKNKKLILESF